MPTLTIVNLLDEFVTLRPQIERVVAHRVGCRATAQDIAQDLFFRLHRIAGPFSTQDDARRYLLRMAVNAATDHLRVEGRRRELLEGLATPVLSDELNPEETLLTDEQIGEVGRALDELPPKCRDVLYLSRVEGLTHAEIAAKLGVSRSLVEKYAIRALLHCRARLDGAP